MTSGIACASAPKNRIDHALTRLGIAVDHSRRENADSDTLPAGVMTSTGRKQP